MRSTMPLCPRPRGLNICFLLQGSEVFSFLSLQGRSTSIFCIWEHFVRGLTMAFFGAVLIARFLKVTALGLCVCGGGGGGGARLRRAKHRRKTTHYNLFFEFNKCYWATTVREALLRLEQWKSKWSKFPVLCVLDIFVWRDKNEGVS